MQDDIRNKTVQGLFWSFFERIGYGGIQFFISIILARLLLPEQFGLIAMLAIFMAVAQSFIDSGFGSALIQKQNATHVDECSVFYFNILVGFLAAGALFLSAPWIAAFYGTPLLVPLTRVLSLNLIINAFGIIQTNLLTKRLDFKSQMKVSVVASILSGAIGVTMAYQGYGVWSLVVQSIGGNLLRTILLWFFLPWRPAWSFSLTSLRSMFSFGSKLLLAGLLNTLFENLYLLVIGKVFSATDLGYYTRAQQTQQLPVTTISSVVARVTFPVFSAIQEDKARLKRAVRKALTTLAFIIFPAMVGLALVAKPLVLVLLTEKWLPCVPYLQLLCVAGMLFPLHVINLNVLLAQGRSDLFFRLEVLKKLLTIIVLIFTWRWGITSIIYGQIFVSFVAYFINAHYTGVLLGYPIMEQVRDFLPSLGLSVAMGLGVLLVGQLPFSSPPIMLSAQTCAGVFFYAIMCYNIRIPIFTEATILLNGKWARRGHQDAD